jgi:two-component system NtrC family sensor kinase
VLEDALVLVGNQARLANIELVKGLGDVPLVRADFGQLRQAVINLLINACDAMPKGGRLEVATRVVPAGFVEIAVADTGCGIPKEQLSKVLDPFFTTKEKGTGLGLSVVYGIVERHAGALDIASEVGAGTTVTIRLPVAPAAGSDRPEAVGAGGRAPRSAA